MTNPAKNLLPRLSLCLAVTCFLTVGCDIDEFEYDPETLEQIEEAAIEYQVPYDLLATMVQETGDDVYLVAEKLALASEARELPGEITAPPLPVPTCDYGNFGVAASCRIATNLSRQVFVYGGDGCWHPVTEYKVNWYFIDYYSNGRIREGSPYQSYWTTTPVTDPNCSTACYGPWPQP